MPCPTLSELPPPPLGRTGWPWTEESPQLPATMPDGRPWPRVSIVTPSYNQAEFIEETIRSVLLQGYPNLEYIIIDGGSTDGSVEIIRKYAPWLAYWVSEPDRGQSHAINKGFERATGEVLAWLNSDDTYEPGALGKVAEFLRAHPDVGMVYGDCRKIDDQGRFIGTCPARAFDMKPLVCNQWFIPQQSAFFRQSVLRAVGAVKEDLHLVMDWDLWLRIALTGFKIVYVPALLASFRIYPETKTNSQFERSGQEKFAVLDSLFVHTCRGDQFRQWKKQAYANVHKFLGIHYYSQKRYLAARRHLLKSAWLRPLQLRRSEFLRPLLVSLIGRPIRCWAQAIKNILVHILGFRRT